MDVYQALCELETTPQALEATVSYLAARMKPFLQTLEPVLICYPDDGPASLGGVFKEAVLRCEATPVFWGPDYRWKELLRIAFDTHANTIVGHPLVMLGLMKLAKATATPLYFYDAILCGDPFSHWIVDDVKRGLDCRVWGCYAVRSGPVVAGFSCEQDAGIHIRTEVFLPCIPDHTMPAEYGSKHGELQFQSAKKPELLFDPMENSLLYNQPCSCGCSEPRVVETKSLREECLSREVMENRFLAWSSVLDYRAEKTESGMALELVVFPGETLPKVHSVAKLKIRPWNPEEDIPFCLHEQVLKIPEKNYKKD